MRTNQAGIDLIKEFECGGDVNKYLTAYLCPSKVWTIGYGTTGDCVHPGLTISEATASSWLAEDLQTFELAVQRLVKVPLNENQFSALVSFAYNCGEGALAGSTALKRLNNQDFSGACEALLWWNKATSGEVLPGLARRRQAEVDLFNKAVSSELLAISSKEKANSQQLIANSFLLNTYRYFKDLPQQQQAIAYLEQHTLADVMQEVQRIWRSEVVSLTKEDVCRQSNEVRHPLSVVSPKTLIDKIVSYYQLNGWKLFNKPGEINICYLKDADENGVPHPAKPNWFDDRSLLFTKKNGQWQIIFNAGASCDPSPYWDENPMNEKGCAWLQLDKQFTAWQVGTHGSGRTAHEALVQSGGEVTVYRDRQQLNRRDPSEELDSGFFGVDHHSAFNADEDAVNKWSAGCQIRRNHSSHLTFMEICKSDPRYQRDNQFVFSSVTIDTQKMIRTVS